MSKLEEDFLQILLFMLYSFLLACEDCIYTTCLMVEGEEIFVIRLVQVSSMAEDLFSIQGITERQGQDVCRSL